MLRFIIAALAAPLMAQIHMSAGQGFTDSSGTVWTSNTCTGSQPFKNPGIFPNPIYNNLAYTASAGVPLACFFPITGVFNLIIHLIEPVKTFNAPQKRTFSITLNGSNLITGLDIFQRSGAIEAPYDFTSTVAAPPSGIVLNFVQIKSSAIFAGIELIPIQTIGNCTVGGPTNADLTCNSFTSTANGQGSLTLHDNSTPPNTITIQAPPTITQSYSLTLAASPPIATAQSSTAQAQYTIDLTSGANWTQSWVTILPSIASIARSQGSASGSNPCTLSDGTQGVCPWTNAGLEMWTMTLTDGTVIGPLVGSIDPSAAAQNVWTAVPLNQPVIQQAK